LSKSNHTNDEEDNEEGGSFQARNKGQINTKTGKDDGTGAIQDVLDFYNTATFGVLAAMSKDIEKGQVRKEHLRFLFLTQEGALKRQY
jgi:hypothetical protein